MKNKHAAGVTALALPEVSLVSGRQESLFAKLTAELDEAVGLLREFHKATDTQDLRQALDLPPNLLEQCLAICAKHSTLQPEPIRTVHHFACTGGTLISKCIASMPNVQLLSEVDPLHTPVKPSARPQFAPTDMVTLMRQSTRGTSSDQLEDLFLSNIEVIYSHAMNDGLRLVLRDHAHSHYCRGANVPGRRNLRELVATKFPTLSVVTVRDPVDSYLSLKANGWVHFVPSTFDEYCRRYLAFIHAYDGVPVIRFEDFVEYPESEMAKLCQLLDLPFNSDFRDLFSVHSITGDSGRSGMIIELRPRRVVDAAFAEEIQSSAGYQEIREIFGYC